MYLNFLMDRLVEGIPSRYVAGIGAIVLTNFEALSREKKRMKVTTAGKKHNLSESYGWYNKKTITEPASIELLVDSFFVDFPRMVTKLHFIQDMVVSKTLFHELGHHVHFEQCPEYHDREKVAEKWSKKIGHSYFWRKYWYILILAYPFKGLIRIFLRRRKHGQ